MGTLAEFIVRYLMENEIITHYHFIQGGRGAQLRLSCGKVLILMLNELTDMRFDHTLSKKRTTKK